MPIPQVTDSEYLQSAISWAKGCGANTFGGTLARHLSRLETQLGDARVELALLKPTVVTGSGELERWS